MQDFQNFLIAKYVEAKMKMEEFLKNEKGEANIIAVILIIAIVVGLVIIFRKNIANMVDKIWSNIGTDLKSVGSGGVGTETNF